MNFSPIAVVGRGCVLPGTHSVEQLWRGVLAGRSFLSAPPPNTWGIEPERVTSRGRTGQIWSDRGGYVRGFDVLFRPEDFAVPAHEITGLDPFVHWLLEAGRQALGEAGYDYTEHNGRAGMIMGNLSLPSRSLSRFAEGVWLESQEDLPDKAMEMVLGPRPDPRNRFMSGLSLELAARALGIGASVFALDAACASSLYAIKLACDALHDGRADVMLAGGVNGTDPLFLHIGFRALHALSPTGQSRPLHRQADGLVPAEGAVTVVLKRLADAERDGNRIYGVIRGVGLSNDGGAGTLLVPDEGGQVAAMTRAFAMSGLEPRDISLLEFHATGTPVGDATEIRSTGTVYRGLADVPVGSLKSNLGHLLTASGAAGLLKVLGGMENGVIPPMLHAEEPLDLIADSPFRLVREPEPWTCSGPRRAAVSSFGFGGNNAHLLVEEWIPANSPRMFTSVPSSPVDVAIVGIGVVAGNAAGLDEFSRAFLYGKADTERFAGMAEIDLGSLHVPPMDLGKALAQQLLVIEVAQEALAQVGQLPADRTAVLVGMQCDAEIARHTARERVHEWGLLWANALGTFLPDDWIDQAQSGIAPDLDSAIVLGSLPNVPANRLNALLRFGGPSFTVSRDELSGITALQLAVRALRYGEIDAAVVGAVDVCCEPVHQTAAKEVLPDEKRIPGDAAVVLILRRLDEARAQGEHVYALLPGSAEEWNMGDSAAPVFGSRQNIDVTSVFGHAHAASGLIHVAAAACCLDRGILPAGNATEPWPWVSHRDGRAAMVQIGTVGAQAETVRLVEDVTSSPRGFIGHPIPRIYTYRGRDRQAIVASLAGEPGEEESGPACLTLVVTYESELEVICRQAAHVLSGAAPTSQGKLTDGIYYYDRPVGGELGFVFTGSGAAYNGMGQELLTAMPDLMDIVTARGQRVRSVVDQLATLSNAAPFDKLIASSLLCQVQARLTLDLLGLSPNAAIGLSSGETNALAALGAWDDLSTLLDEIEYAELYSRKLGGSFEAVRRAWHRTDGSAIEWATWHLQAPAREVREALDDEPHVYLTIVYTPEQCEIAGDADACRRVVHRLGTHRASPLDAGLAVHCPVVREVADVWRAIHRRPTAPVTGVRFYSGAMEESYRAEIDLAADALLDMGCTTVDFARAVNVAWQDSVRIFVEHGPGGYCSRYIDEILGDREHVSVSLDARGTPAVLQAVNVAAHLVAAGIEVDIDVFMKRLDAAYGWTTPDKRPRQPTRILEVPTHPGPIQLPALGEDMPQRMEPAPELPVDDERAVIGGEGVTQASDHSVSAAPDFSPPVPHRPGPPVLQTQSLINVPLKRAAAHTEYLAQAGAAHREYLRLQGVAQQRFVETSRRAWNTFMQALTIGIASDPARSADEQPARMLSRAELEIHASGRISDIFGPLFTRQDGFRCQVRMPEPPLLLVDRVTALQGEPGALGLGSISTETDIRRDSWYLHDGYIPPGILIETGQADLCLISWLGIDFVNRGERVYRLLGCEVTYHGDLPAAGTTLQYDIQIDRHAQSGNVRLFFFHSDCRTGDTLRLSVRNGCAGFFSNEELHESGGVLWEAETGECRTVVQLNSPPIRPTARCFGEEQVRAFAEGRTFDCFGAGYELSLTHVRSPRVQHGPMLLFDRVTNLDPEGSPWRRGYMRAEKDLRGDEWFFPGHFKNDPTMPGTLMLEGGLQGMAFYLAALGFTLERDGWRFQPVPERPYTMVCRGQVTPASRRLVYEIFVEELIGGPEPTLFADILLSVDGLKAFHCRGFGLQLVPDWPLTSRPELLDDHMELKPIATHGGVEFGYPALLACAWGRPSEASGQRFEIFDGPRRLPRLPGPPYHFMSRVLRVEGDLDVLGPGGVVECEYDVPPDAWYFKDDASTHMPFCVLLECGLQPCGWLASYLGVPLATEAEYSFRNLDGTGTLTRTVRPDAGTIRTVATLNSISRSGETFIESYAVRSFLGDEPIFEMDTIFGHFPRPSLARQVGLPASEEERTFLALASNMTVDLRQNPMVGASGTLGLPDGMLLMLDRVTGYWSGAEAGGKERLRGEMDVDPAAWFFKAHFFQDPVQPGSLGLEAMLQLLQFYMLHKGMDAGISDPQFLPLDPGRPLTWVYRGQVLPHSRRVTVELEIIDTVRDAGGSHATANAWLWVDGLRIYGAHNLTMRIVPGKPHFPAELPRPVDTMRASLDSVEEILDPRVDTWLDDHRPTYAVPAFPLTFMAERLASAVQRQRPEWRVVELKKVQAHRWLTVAEPRRLRVDVEVVDDRAGPFDATLLAWREASMNELSRFETVATGQVILAPEYPPAPAPLPSLQNPEPAPNPYEIESTIHGPAFHVLQQLTVGDGGSSALFDAAATRVPSGLIGPLLLDAVTHAIPMGELWRWSPEISPEEVGYSLAIERATFHSETPQEGLVQCEVRFAGFDTSRTAQTPVFEAQLMTKERLWVSMRLTAALLPKGPLGSALGPHRRAFLRDRTYVPGLRLSTVMDEKTVLRSLDVKATDWLPGTVAATYGTTGSLDTVARDIAIKEHVGAQLLIHPWELQVQQNIVTCAVTPLTLYHVSTTTSDGEVSVRDAGPPTLDLATIRAYWRSMLGTHHQPIQDIFTALIARFVRRIVVRDPMALDEIRGQAAVFVANHQVHLESVLASAVIPVLMNTPLAGLARVGVREMWSGELMDLAISYPDEIPFPALIVYFDQYDQVAALQTLRQCRDLLDQGISVLIHADGKRAFSARQPVATMSSAVVDMALAAGAPIVPLRFVGGLPIHCLDQPLHAPYGYGTQDYVLGRPIQPDNLRAFPYGERRNAVLNALNSLGPGQEEEPNPPDTSLAQDIRGWMEATGATEEYAVLLRALQRLQDPSREIQQVVEAVRSGRLMVPHTAQGRWLARLSRQLFGVRGPEVVVEGTGDD